jgi:hypothetical protein
MGPNQLGTRLREVIESLIDSARQVALPGWIWIAGLIYPSIKVSLELGSLHKPALELSDFLEGNANAHQDGAFAWEEALGELFTAEDLQLSLLGIAGSLLFLIALGIPLILLVSRLNAGLAACASPESWKSPEAPTKPPSLSLAWASGRGLSWSSFGVSVLLGLMQVIAFILLVGVPVTFFKGVLEDGSLDEGGALFAAIYLPLAGVLILYSLVIGALHQLALHSLVENRRGMTSALRHAWRLLRVNSQTSFSFLLVEICCVLAYSLTALVIGLSSAFLCLLTPLSIFIMLALRGFAGVLRAAFWARAYRQMGGATSGDRLGGIGATPSQG